MKQCKLHYGVRLITQITSERKKKVKLRSEQLLHDQWARVRSDVVVFGNGFIQIQLPAVDLHLHAAIIKSSHWCSTQRNICTKHIQFIRPKHASFYGFFRSFKTWGILHSPSIIQSWEKRSSLAGKLSLKSRSSQQS